MKIWNEFCREVPELGALGKGLLFPSRPKYGRAFLATVRKDGAPRLHPVSLILYKDCLYVFISSTSPKCNDLKRDGRFAMQAFPPPINKDNEEFYIAGRAERVPDISIRKALLAATKIRAEENEVLFKLLLDRVMYTKLVNRGTPDEHPIHIKWRATGETR